MVIVVRLYVITSLSQISEILMKEPNTPFNEVIILTSVKSILKAKNRHATIKDIQFIEKDPFEYFIKFGPLVSEYLLAFLKLFPKPDLIPTDVTLFISILKMLISHQKKQQEDYEIIVKLYEKLLKELPVAIDI